MKKLFALVLALMLVLGAVAVAEEPLYISVISKGEQHAFWQTVRTGCEEAAAEYGVEMYYYGPPSAAGAATSCQPTRRGGPSSRPDTPPEDGSAAGRFQTRRQAQPGGTNCRKQACAM